MSIDPRAGALSAESDLVEVGRLGVYAEALDGEARLERILAEATVIVDRALER